MTPALWMILGAGLALVGVFVYFWALDAVKRARRRKGALHG